MPANPLLDAALQYAGRKWPIFPVTKFKMPLKGSHGWKDGSIDVELARQRFEGRRVNIAVATGGEWGVIVFDADGPGGMAALQAFTRQYGPLPETLVQQTPRGNLHYFYRLPAGVRLRKRTGPRAQKGDDGLDFMADGAYVLLEPSSVPRVGAYQWVLQRPIAELPAAAVEALRQAYKAPDAAPPPQTAPLLGERPSYLPPDIVAGASFSDRLQESLIQSELVEFLDALRWIPASCGYDEWFEDGAGIHDFDPGPLGKLIFLKWSLTSRRHTPEEVEKAVNEKWLEYEKPKPGKRLHTKAHIYSEANQYKELEARKQLDDKPGEKPETEAKTEFNGVHFALPAEFTAVAPAKILFPDVIHGKPRPTCRNARVAIRQLGLTCEHDVFHDKLRIGGQAVGQWAGEVTDNSIHMLRVVIEQQFHFDPGTQSTLDAAVQECLLKPFDPVLGFLDGLRWDGTPRLDTWMTSYLGAEPGSLNSAIGRLALIAAVRRARSPGCKFDQIIVLEGPEGRGKSSVIESLAGRDNFSDQSILTLDDKGQQEALQGVWLYEIADLAGHSRAEVERVKAFASRTTDRARPAYGRARLDRPRRCVFFATTNSDTYLKSQTGNRRFWPVRCGRIDLDALARDREQLWAEVVRGERGASLTLPEALWRDAGAVQDSRRDHDPWDDILQGVQGKLTEDGREYRVTTFELMAGRLQLPTERHNDVTSKRVAFAMRRLGWDGPKLIREGGAVARGYTRGPL